MPETRAPDYSVDLGEYTVTVTRDGQQVRAAVARLDQPIGIFHGTTVHTDLTPHYIDIARDALARVLSTEREEAEEAARLRRDEDEAAEAKRQAAEAAASKTPKP